MKKFKFRYESILQMRLKREDAIKNELAQAIAEKNKYVERQLLIKETLKTYMHHIEDAIKTGKANNEMHAFYSGKKYYMNKIKDLDLRIKKANDNILAIQSKLSEAMKERKIMDKLKEKDFQTYIDEFNEAEAKVIEEIVNYKNSQKNGE